MATPPFPAINNRASLSHWLMTRDNRDSLVIALRATLRMAPKHWGPQIGKAGGPGPLPVCRCLLLAEAAWRFPEVDLAEPVMQAFASEAIKGLAKGEFLPTAARTTVATVTAKNYAERASDAVNYGVRASTERATETALWSEVAAD